MTTGTSVDLATEFKTAFRHHPAGIALVTTASSSGPVGLTASSVASVGLDPMSLSFSVTRSTGSAGEILRSDSFVVHLLDSRHSELAGQFATSGGERFTSQQGWEKLPTGEPYLPGAQAAFRCRSLHTVPVGESTVIIAEVLDIRAAQVGSAMIYQDRAFRSVGDALS